MKAVIIRMASGLSSLREIRYERFAHSAVQPREIRENRHGKVVLFLRA